MGLKPQARSARMVIQEVREEVLVYDLETNKAVCLNETSAVIWSLCDGQKTVVQIADEVSKKLKCAVNKDLVWLALEQLKKEQLLQNDDDFGSRFEGLTRREVVRNIAMTSMVALPIVSAIVAPQASFAQSGGCMVGDCIPPNVLACSICNPGQIIGGDVISSTDGSCSGTNNGLAFSGLTCGADNASNTTDMIITSVS